MANGLNLKNCLAALSTQGPLMQITLQVHRTTSPHCAPVVWASPYKGVSGTVFQPTELRLSLSNQSGTAIPLPTTSMFTEQWDQLILTNQDSAFWTTGTVRIWSPHLHGETQIRYQGQGLVVSISQLPSGSKSTLPFPFYQGLKIVFSDVSPDLTHPGQNGAVWTRADGAD